MIKKLLYILILFSFVSNAQQLAFPTATGAGAYTTGGRGGVVVHVTNLNATGAGSFAEAMTMTVPRIIVFDVSGVININKLLYLDENNSNFTLAGQTAPEGGITIAGGRVYFDNVSNYIMRHIRFKGGFQADTVPNSGDNLGSASFSGVGTQLDIIVDHCTFSLGRTVSTWTQQGTDGRVFDKVTIQRCLFTETELGAIMGRDVDQNLFESGNGTFSKNVFYNARYRTPNVNAIHSGDNSYDVINNLTWNAQGRFIRGAGDLNLNHINNATYVRTFSTGDQNLNMFSEGWNPKIYTNGNFFEITSLGSLTSTVSEMNADNTLSWKYFVGANYGNQLPSNFFVGTPYSIKGASQTILDATDLRTTLPNDVGCNARLNADGTVNDNKDSLDASSLQNILNDVMTTPIDPASYSVPSILSVSRPTGYDTDQDGIPDTYEIAQGWNPNVANDDVLDASGYTQLELFLNEVDGAVTPPTAVTSVSIAPSTANLSVGNTAQLTETVLPVNASNKTGVWSSSSDAIATVSSSGLVTGISNGVATITFTTNDGSFTDTSTITVTTPSPRPSNKLRKKVKTIIISNN